MLSERKAVELKAYNTLLNSKPVDNIIKIMAKITKLTKEKKSGGKIDKISEDEVYRISKLYDALNNRIKLAGPEALEGKSGEKMKEMQKELPSETEFRSPTDFEFENLKEARKLTQKNWADNVVSRKEEEEKKHKPGLKG